MLHLEDNVNNTNSGTELLIDYKKVFVRIKYQSLLAYHTIYLSTVVKCLGSNNFIFEL